MYESTIVHFAEVARDKSHGMRQSPFGFFVGAMLAGAYIGIAMILALSSAAGLPPGVRPLVMGATFGIGLILCVFAGAELFTGYVMYTGFGLARSSIRVADAVRLLLLVWFGNLAGAVLLSVLFIAGGGGAVLADGGSFLNSYVTHKVDADATALLARAALCNWLVCVAIWTAARTSGDAAKCLLLGWVLMTFVTAGFEHSVANMTALTLGLLDPHPAISLWGAWRNLLIVTVGNIAGSAIFVVGGYLCSARTERSGPAFHDAGLLSTALREKPADPASPSSAGLTPPHAAEGGSRPAAMGLQGPSSSGSAS